MTEVSTTLRSAYLAGPMRGHPHLNFPEFHKQTAWLRAGGWTVFSPAERDEADEALNGDFSVGQERGLDYYMQFDLAAVAQTDCVICLEAWESSQGARLETVTAVELGHSVLEIVRTESGRMLMHVDPQYVRDIFYAGGQCVIGAASSVLDTTDTLPEHDTEGETCWCSPRVEHVAANTSAARKAQPIASGVLDYFPAALLEVSKVSKAGNDKHNPGQPLHHARGKSTDHADALLRHLIDRGDVDEETGMRHSAEMAWRALALLQQELEDEGAPLARGAVLPEG